MSVSYEGSVLHEAVFNQNIGLVRCLINQKVYVDAKDSRYGDTPLHVVAKHVLNKNSEVLVEILMIAGADPSILNENGQAPLHEAVGSRNLGVIRQLIRHGANVDVNDIIRRTVLHKIADNDEWLLQDESSYLEAFELILKAKPNVDAMDGKGVTPLFIATGANNVPAVELLLKNHANIDKKVKFGATALFLSAFSGHTEVLELLMKHGAALEVKTSDGTTLLSCECLHGEKKKECLMRQGADIRRNNITGFFDGEESDEGKIERLAVIIATVNETMPPSILNLISSINSDLYIYYKKCTDELLLAQQMSIHHEYNIKFFDFLYPDISKIFGYTKNKDLTLYLENIDWKKMFPIYGSEMKANVSEAIDKRHLYNTARKSFQKCWPMIDAVIEKIFDFLDEEDLNNLCKLYLK